MKTASPEISDRRTDVTDFSTFSTSRTADHVDVPRTVRLTAARNGHPPDAHHFTAGAETNKRKGMGNYTELPEVTLVALS
jgi:hypothetical protein